MVVAKTIAASVRTERRLFLQMFRQASLKNIFCLIMYNVSLLRVQVSKLSTRDKERQKEQLLLSQK
jgi:hypothetical protein